MNTLQWSRVDRAPPTYNVKEKDAWFSKIKYPSEFTHSDFNWSESQLLDPRGVAVVGVSMPRVVKPKLLTGLGNERKWIQRIVKNRVTGWKEEVLVLGPNPYLAVVRQLSEEEVLSICQKFLEDSYRNHSGCDKDYG